MNFLLLLLACLVFSAEEPLPFLGKFNTIYLAGNSVSLTAENSQVRMLMCEVKFFNQRRVMSMTFYVRSSGMCQLHTVWADKIRLKYCSIKRNLFLGICPKRNGTQYIPSTWMVRDAFLHFPNIYFYPEPEGGRKRLPSGFFIMIHFVSNTTILFEVQFFNDGNNFQRLAGALATGTNITEEMWEEYVNLTQYLRIPTENIENTYETDACPKWEP